VDTLSVRQTRFFGKRLEASVLVKVLKFFIYLLIFRLPPFENLKSPISKLSLFDKGIIAPLSSYVIPALYFN